MATLRETTAVILSQSRAVRQAAQVDMVHVYQAETVSSALVFPFIVLRWMQAQPGLAQVKRRPFMIWSYDDAGDYARAERVANAAAAELLGRSQIKTDSGWILAFEEQSGDGQGEDLIDTAYNASVVPYSLTAIASGS